MGEKRVKTFYDITARRWNDIINAVNGRRPADSIEPPLEEHELAEFRKMEKEKAEAERDGGCPLIFDNVEYDYDDPELDIYSTPVSTDINYSDMDSQDLPLKLHEAIRFAEEKHRAQKRKGTDIAYIIHPMEVLQILMGERCSIEVAIAGVLHDVLEDTDADADEIRARFGDHVLSLVQAHTEKKQEEGQKRPWRIRKEEDLARMRESGLEVKQIVMADSISNLRSMVYDYRAVGDELWERFNASKEDIAWYYSAKIDAFEEMQYIAATRDDYWELNSLFKHLFVDYYVIEDTAIYQKSGSEIYILRRDDLQCGKRKKFRRMPHLL